MIYTLGLGFLAMLCSYADISLFSFAGVVGLAFSLWIVCKGKPEQPGLWHELRFAPAVLGVISLTFF